MVKTASDRGLPPQVPDDLLTDSACRRGGRYLKAFFGARGMALAAWMKPIGTEGFGVFNYHRVHPQAGLPISVTPAAFERQVTGLLRRGYTSMTVAEYLDVIDGGYEVPRKAFAITFDDAYDSVREFALPILQKHGLRASVYLATGWVGKEHFDFDPLVYQNADGDSTVDVAPEVVRPLDLAGCRELFEAGWELGAHTRTHRFFHGFPEEFEEDVAKSVEWLRYHFGIVSPTFSFPYGRLDHELKEVCRRAAVRCALTTENQLITSQSDRYDLGRLGAEEFDTGASLAAKLNGWYGLARRLWRRVAYGDPAYLRQNGTAVERSESQAGGVV